MTKKPKIKKTFLLAPDTINKLEQLSNEFQLAFGATIDKVVALYFENRTEQHEVLVESIKGGMEQILRPMLEDLNRVRVTSNVIDRNTQMMIEFWNHYFVMSAHKTLGSTDKFKTVPVIEAEQLIKDRISHNRQKKLDWEAKRQKNNEVTEES